MSWPARARRNMCWGNKEVRFFSLGPTAGVDICWYRDRYPCLPTEAEQKHSYALFDGSPDYFILPETDVTRMANVLGSATRLMVMLRNPSDRFYSAYNMGMNELKKKSGRGQAATYHEFAGDPVKSCRTGARLINGIPSSGSLDRWIQCAPLCRQEPRIVNMFFEYGLYAKHLMKYYTHFPRERVLLIKSEDFFAHPLSVMQAVIRFAQLSEYDLGFNASIMRRNSGEKWGRNYSGKLLLPERNKLMQYYAPYNRELYQLVGRNFGWEMDWHL